jgi:hypothetical protein
MMKESEQLKLKMEREEIEKNRLKAELETKKA